MGNSLVQYWHFGGLTPGVISLIFYFLSGIHPMAEPARWTLPAVACIRDGTETKQRIRAFWLVRAISYRQIGIYKEMLHTAAAAEEKGASGTVLLPGCTARACRRRYVAAESPQVPPAQS